MINNFCNDINSSIAKKKKSFTGILKKKSIKYNNELIKINIIKDCYRINKRYASKFSIKDNNLKIKKLNNEFKYSFK